MEFTLIDQSLIDARIARTNRLSQNVENFNKRIKTFFSEDVVENVSQVVSEPAKTHKESVTPITENVANVVKPQQQTSPKELSDLDLDNILNGIDFGTDLGL